MTENTEDFVGLNNLNYGLMGRKGTRMVLHDTGLLPSEEFLERMDSMKAKDGMEVLLNFDLL